MGVLSIFLALYSLLTELIQFKHAEKKKFYFKSLLNWVDIFGLVGTILINVVILAELTFISMQNLRVVGAVIAFLLIFKMYDWCRLFDKTAFYVLLVEATLKDVSFFLFLLLLALLMFGVPISILNFNRDDKSKIVSDSIGFWLIDCIFNQYLLALGEFASLDSYADSA